MNKKNIPELKLRITSLKKNREDLVDTLDFYSKIIDLYEGFDDSGCGEPVEVPDAAAKGPYPYIDLSSLDLDYDSSLPLFRDICGTFEDYVEEIVPEVLKIKDDSDKDTAATLKKAFAAYLKTGMPGGEKDTEGIPPQLAFIAFLALRPCIEKAVSDSRGLLDNEFGVYEPACPVCGGMPVMSKIIKEEGFRLLVCGVCETSWLFKRMKCTSCGNEEPKTLGYIYSEDKDIEECYTAATCEKCKQYIKTLDTRKNDITVDVVLEAIATAHWDLLAQREGYRPLTPWHSADASS